jgi:hypothetical protein
MMGELTRHIEITLLWLISFAASLTVVAARVGFYMYGVNAEQPPEDPAVLRQWKRKRTWLLVSELSALPAFATLGVVATDYYNLSPIASVLIAMVLGALGFGFLLHAVEVIVRRRLEIKHD